MPILTNNTFCIDEFPGLTCPIRHRMTVAAKAEMEKQGISAVYVEHASGKQIGHELPFGAKGAKTQMATGLLSAMNATLTMPHQLDLSLHAC